MNSRSVLEVHLLSDTTFAGDHAGDLEVDVSIQQDADGLPVLSARALKGLLVEGCAGVLRALGPGPWEETAAYLFGEPGAAGGGRMYVSDATLPEGVRVAVHEAVTRGHLDPGEVLESLTAVRRQTRIGEDGTAAPHSLRASRVLMRGLTLEAPLAWADPPPPEAEELLVLSALNVRRAGLLRHRGRGRVAVRYRDGSGRDVTESIFRRWLKHAGIDIPVEPAGPAHHS